MIPGDALISRGEARSFDGAGRVRSSRRSDGLLVGMTAVVRLRPLAAEDAEVMSSVLADPTLYEFTGGEPPSVEELGRRYAIQTRGQSADGTEDWINYVVILDPGQTPIGYVQATVHRNRGSAEIAWVIGREWQGKGYATRAARLLVENLEERGVHDLTAHIHPDHVASQSVARNLGLVLTTIVIDGEQRWQRDHESNEPLPAN